MSDKPSILGRKLGALSIGEAIIFFVAILLVFTLIYSAVEAYAYKQGMKRMNGGTPAPAPAPAPAPVVDDVPISTTVGGRGMGAY